MKKKMLLLSLIPLAFSLLTGCEAKCSPNLTFGTYVEQSFDTIKSLDNTELYNKAYNDKETFLLAVYQGGYSESCTCWTTFQNIIILYMNTHNERVYVYDAQSQDESVKDLKIQKVSNSAVSLYVFNGNKQLAKFSDRNAKDESIFTDTTANAMYQRVHKIVKKPQAYYVDDTILKNKMSESTSSVVLFVREGCGDCKYVIPNIVIPYINKNIINKELWIFDLQDLYDLSKNEASTEEQKRLYQATKDEYMLSDMTGSGTAKYGYRDGVVPTIQYYENDSLKDAAVFFNDSVRKKEDDTFYVSESYYSDRRLPNLNYLKDVDFTTCLEGLVLKNTSVLETPSGDYYWSQKEAAKYYTPIFTRFLDYYLL